MSKLIIVFFFFKQKTAYEMRISDWSSDVCSSDLLGETTDVVSKEMYTFPDRGGDSLTLRPEFTAGIARAYLTEGWQQFAPLKIAASGPVFRYERPQKGRYRQFHQIDSEIISAGEPAADHELMVFGEQIFRDRKSGREGKRG